VVKGKESGKIEKTALKKIFSNGRGIGFFTKEVSKKGISWERIF